MSGKTRFSSARAEHYAHLVRPFASAKGIRQRGNWLAYMLFLINLHGAVFLATLIWYVVVIKLWHPAAVAVVQPLVVTTILFSTWFLFRRYSQWYQFGVYKEKWAGTQQIFFILLFVAILGAGTLYLIGNKVPTLAIGAFVGGAWAFLKVAEKSNWQWANRALGACVDWLAGCRFAHFTVLYAALVGFFTALAHSAVVTEPIKPPTPASADTASVVRGGVKQASRP